ncbi:type II secretion system protein M [Idiomarina tyrosinivorans]|uniref:Type II secretion system protein M n=1 Tax=Idiomarina tyrosinivorans TaxID=1445662 RepID=A0A432ZQY6_9GAMM|nr:type II secretion system protein M [Idiomarina tyrosinivorans]RUO80293.1 type II secretion system protein M [Idiomarina tyrosinivorans]
MSRVQELRQKLRQHPLAQRAESYWNSLQLREQRLIAVLGAVVVVAIIYFAMWQPIHNAVQRLETQKGAAQQQLLWTQQKIAQYQQWQSRNQNKSSPSGSPSQRISTAANSFDIELSRIQPQGDAYLVAIDQVSFNALLQFIQALQSREQLLVSALDIAELSTPGAVRVRKLLVEEAR